MASSARILEGDRAATGSMEPQSLWGLTLLPLYRVVSHHAASRAVCRYAARRLGRVVVKRGLDGWNAIRQ
jgi:hypothetical protein